TPLPNFCLYLDHMLPTSRSVGIGIIHASASFSVLVPVIMTDLFQDRHLGIALMSINIAGLVAIMVSVTFGSWVVSSGSPWQSGLIGVPLIAIVPLLCLLWAKNNLRNVQKHDKGIAKIFVDALSILSIKSFILLSATYSLTNFATAAYNFWFPSMYLIIWDTTPDIFLGIPYTVVTILNSGAMIVGMAMGIPTLMWFAQSWRYGTGLFEGRNEYLRAYPIVVSAGSSLNAASFILSIIMLDRSYLACLASTFFVGIGTAADASLSQQMMLMVVPSSERAAAIALSRLISSIVGIPSAQIVGLIADLIRGDSTLPSDRFHAYQLASLCASSLLIASVICFLLLAFSFNLDCEKAKEIKDKEEEEEADERTALIEKEALLSKE
ncbi:hypothetical protein PMAYCL1PPCAC_22506, partial [Pristionchus mayeri]